MGEKIKKQIKTYLLLVLSCLACGTAVNWILLPNGFVTTGTTGLSIVLEGLTGVNFTIVCYAITLVIVIAAFAILGKKELVNIIFLSILYPTVLLVTQFINVSITFENKLVAILAFGILYGLGVGISYRLGYSYGGTDTLGKILKATVLRFVPLKVIFMLLDAVICAILFFTYGLDLAAYAIIGQIVYADVMNYVVFDFGMQIYQIHIISSEPEKIRNYILNDLHRGVTVHHAVGGYTGEDKIKLDCVCSPREFVLLKEYVGQVDPRAFIEVFPVVCVIGEGKQFYDIDEAGKF